MVKRIMHAAAYRLGTFPMQIVDLRQLSSWQLEPLLAEEAQQWRQELHWDYRASVELIKKFVDARSLTGSAILENGRPVGYAFYVLEDHKGLVGGLFVSPRYSQQELSQRLLTDTLTTLSGIPKLERVEAQLIPFGYALDPVLSEYGFRLYMRQFMIAPLAPADNMAGHRRPSRADSGGPGRRADPGALGSPLFRALRAVDPARLRESRRRRNQRSVPQRIRRAAFSEEHHYPARLRTISARSLLRAARRPMPAISPESF